MDLPVGSVGDSVVVAAEESHGVGVCSPVVVVGGLVVGVAVCGRHVASGEDAASVADREGGLLCWGGVAAGASVAKRVALAIADERCEVGICEQVCGRFG